MREVINTNRPSYILWKILTQTEFTEQLIARQEYITTKGTQAADSK